MASSKGAAGVDNTSRKTWDKAEFADKASERDKKDKAAEDSALDARKRKRLERDPLHQGLIVQRANLQARDYQIDLASKLGKSQVQSAAMPLSHQAGYYCDVCDCVLKDSLAYLDHINGKWHNRALGMSMRVEKSSVEQVRSRLDALKKQKAGGASADGEVDHVPDGVSRAELDKEARLLDDKAHNDDEEEEEQNDEDGLAVLMGFGGFGSSKT